MHALSLPDSASAARPVPPLATAPQRHGVAVVLGTRPEIIKLAPLIRALGPDARVVHTGQHYDADLSDTIWTGMGLPVPESDLGVGGVTRASQIGLALVRLDTLFAESPPEVVVVQGDTNATVAGAIAANAHGIPLVHVEAGLRSFDPAMPEEHNRVLVDHLADVLCAATPVNVENLVAEGLPRERIHLTGNTVVEAVEQTMPTPEQQARILREHGVVREQFVLATIHRPENTDDTENLRLILTELGRIGLPVLLPLHPRTRARLESTGLDRLLDGLLVTEPMSREHFLALAANAAVLVSDSGGVQEEASILKRPLLIVRRSTERPEVVGTFALRTSPREGMHTAVNVWAADPADTHARLSDLPSPYGDGQATASIAALIERLRDGSGRHSQNVALHGGAQRNRKELL